MLSWIPINSGLVDTLNIRDFDYLAPYLIVSTWDGGIFRSSNDTTWEQINNGLTCPNVSVLTVKGSSIFAGSSGMGVFKSDDNGNTWVQKNNGLTTLFITTMTVKDNLIIIGTYGGGIFVSGDDGETWTPANSGLTNYVVRTLNTINDRILLGTSKIIPPGGDIDGLGDNGGLFISDNDCSNWIQSNAGLTNWNVQSLVIKDSNIFIGTDGGGVFKSTDNGDSWTEVNNGLTSKQVVLSTSSSGVFAGAWEGGVFVSNDDGASWTNQSSGMTDYRLFSIYVKNNDIFAGTYAGGVFKSCL